MSAANRWLSAITIHAFLLVFILLTGLACQTSGGAGVGNGGDPTDSPPPVGGDTPDDWYSLYFTQPDAPSSASLRGGPDKHLAEAILGARASVEVAALQLDLWSLRDALIDVHQRGINVRMVVESDYLEQPEIQQLIAAGVPVLGDRREGLMHNKFVVIDRQEVWTGSMNLTINGAYRNNNNLVRIRASKLAQDYLAEFEEMFVDDHFGPGPHADTPHPAFEIDGILLEAYFSPDDGTAERLVDLIEAAQESVYFLAYSFTSDPLAAALIERHQAGVTVAGVIEASQYESNAGTEYENLRRAGIDVRLDGNRDNMHHKVLVIDGQIVVTGSYNFSRSAEERNDENTLIIHDPQAAAAYLAEFNTIYAAAKP
jgi:phosphatidylserine/phosphatidylglycerophosphate/cardiolipin synthase-like enzyme